MLSTLGFSKMLRTFHKTKSNSFLDSKVNLEHVKGKRNKLFEEDFICRVRERQDKRFIPPCNESIVPFPDILQLQKSLSMPNLTKDSSLVENYKKNDGKFINSICSSEILNCLQIKQFRSFGAQTDCNLVPTEKVIVEKKSADCVGLDFGTAGIYIKNVDADEVFFKQGCLVAGDEVISINGNSVIGLNTFEVFSIYIKSSLDVFLEVRKGAFLSKGVVFKNSVL
ncbi:uncharacterized protein LOC105844115 isoform X4 [Hydra vulgaris]|uniref:Uncharacterized protein LOC105844115 isoform X4 n=1 Tax=Hydra vulgaris TaxID=6087 RepID=A0ABM4CI63_HYDVU